MARTAQTYASQPLLAQDWPNESHNSQHDTQPYQQTITDHPVWSQSGEQEQGLQHCYGQIAAPRSVAASTLSSPAADAQTVVAAHYCAPVTTTFFVKDKLLSWSGSDANILDEHGNIAFVVDSKTLSLRGSRVLKDATGNSVCALQAKVISEHKKWVIYRGATVSDSTMVATVKKALWSMHSGVEVRLAGGSKAEYTLRQQGIITGRREVDIMHHNRVIGRATRMRSGEAIFLDKQSYRVTLSPDYDHAFLLCVFIILDEYYHDDRGGN